MGADRLKKRARKERLEDNVAHKKRQDIEADEATAEDTPLTAFEQGFREAQKAQQKNGR